MFEGVSSTEVHLSRGREVRKWEEGRLQAPPLKEGKGADRTPGFPSCITVEFKSYLSLLHYSSTHRPYFINVYTPLSVRALNVVIVFVE